MSKYFSVEELCVDWFKYKQKENKKKQIVNKKN